MSRVQEIKQAIDKLNFEDRAELTAMLPPLAYDEWDTQMPRDSEPGRKLDRLRESAQKDYQEGKCTEWPPRAVPPSS